MNTKDSVLKALEKCTGKFISGEELSKTLKVSRTAVWKAINNLREEGYPIEAVTNKGYLLMERSWQISDESLKACLPGRYKNNPVYIYDTIDSTNIKARQFTLQKNAHGTIIIAKQQTGGRGRLGRNFFSPVEGLYLSIIIKPHTSIEKSLLITSAAAVAVAETIEEIAGFDARIKWINDVYIDNKKVCGILTEGITDLETGQIEYLIAGIGINTTLRDFPPELRETAGAVTGTYSKSALAAGIITRTLDFAEDIDQASFIDSYRKKSLITGKTVTVYKGQYKIDPDDDIPGKKARVLNIADDGGLIVLYSDGSQEKLISGEISIRF